MPMVMASDYCCARVVNTRVHFICESNEVVVKRKRAIRKKEEGAKRGTKRAVGTDHFQR